jgi:hypothetical protein
MVTCWSGKDRQVPGWLSWCQGEHEKVNAMLANVWLEFTLGMKGSCTCAVEITVTTMGQDHVP